MNFVTYNNIRLKCYLKFIYLAPHEVAGSPMVARAINIFKMANAKKIIFNGIFHSTYFRLQNLQVFHLTVGSMIFSV